MYKSQLPDEYVGTLSSVPNRDGDPPAPSPRERRGKYKGNKKRPRTTVRALGDCVVYANADDYKNNVVARVIPRSKRERATQEKDSATVARIEKVTKHVTFKQEFAERYRREHNA